jgi:hypothetical protein
MSTRATSYLFVLGTMWMPNAPIAQNIPLDQWMIENMMDEGTITRDDVDLWLATHAGDFKTVIDFSAWITLPDGTQIDIAWEKEENHLQYMDLTDHNYA